MQSVLIVIHLLVVIALVGVVLLQRSEGGALGTGGGGGFMTGRGQANALSRATAILGTLFFASAMLMSILAGWNRAPRSILDSAAPPAATSTEKKPAGQSSLLDQLKSMGGPSGQTPAAPMAPAPTPDAPK
jgi:preprotein translocase subunit SecG